MGTITELRKQNRRDRRIHVYLDGEFAFSLEKDIAAGAGLRIGQEVPPQDAAELIEKDQKQKCYNAACRFLSYRPRSEQEVRQRLSRQGHGAACIQQTMARLKELGFVDDTQFARLWVGNRDDLRPRGRRLMKLELQQKGLPRDIIEQAVGDIDEAEAAYRAAQKKAGILSNTDYDTFRKRLAAHLGRRGFGYDTINSTVERIWKEKEYSVS